MCPTSARYGSLAFGVSLWSAGLLGAAAAVGGSVGCAGWLGFMFMGLLSSGRAFHISAPFFFGYRSVQKIKNEIMIRKSLSQNQSGPSVSLLLYCANQIVTVGVRRKGNSVPTRGIAVLNFSYLHNSKQ
jgi:hypothetical protein